MNKVVLILMILLGNLNLFPLSPTNISGHVCFTTEDAAIIIKKLRHHDIINLLVLKQSNVINEQQISMGILKSQINNKDKIGVLEGKKNKLTKKQSRVIAFVVVTTTSLLSFIGGFATGVKVAGK